MTETEARPKAKSKVRAAKPESESKVEATSSKSPGAGSAEPPAAPIDEEMLLDHEYDGILEYDNPMPRWWKAIFWGSFVFSLGYVFHYHLSHHGQSVAEAYAADMQEAAAMEAKRALSEKVSEESLKKLMADQAMMAEARQLFAGKCVACHADKGQGLVGPNLTDDHWIHGKGSLMDVFQVVNEGVPAKGMPAWGKQLSPKELRAVVALVGTMKDTNIAGKAPEGTKAGPE